MLLCLGAIAPVTDDDALAHVVPIARHIAETDTLRIWMDQARSMWPRIAGDSVGVCAAERWRSAGRIDRVRVGLLCLGVVSALARRACERTEHIAAAVVIAVGAPATAFLVPSAKEDLLLLAASTAAAFCLVGGSMAELAAAGLFAVCAPQARATQV